MGNKQSKRHVRGFAEVSEDTPESTPPKRSVSPLPVLSNQRQEEKRENLTRTKSTNSIISPKTPESQVDVKAISKRLSTIRPPFEEENTISELNLAAEFCQQVFATLISSKASPNLSSMTVSTSNLYYLEKIKMDEGLKRVSNPFINDHLNFLHEAIEDENKFILLLETQNKKKLPPEKESASFNTVHDVYANSKENHSLKKDFREVNNNKERNTILHQQEELIRKQLLGYQTKSTLPNNIGQEKNSLMINSNNFAQYNNQIKKNSSSNNEHQIKLKENSDFEEKKITYENPKNNLLNGKKDTYEPREIPNFRRKQSSDHSDEVEQEIDSDSNHKILTNNKNIQNGGKNLVGINIEVAAPTKENRNENNSFRDALAKEYNKNQKSKNAFADQFYSDKTPPNNKRAEKPKLVESKIIYSKREDHSQEVSEDLLFKLLKNNDSRNSEFSRDSLKNETSQYKTAHIPSDYSSINPKQNAKETNFNSNFLDESNEINESNHIQSDSDDNIHKNLRNKKVPADQKQKTIRYATQEDKESDEDNENHLILQKYAKGIEKTEKNVKKMDRDVFINYPPAQKADSSIKRSVTPKNMKNLPFDLHSNASSSKIKLSNQSSDISSTNNKKINKVTKDHLTKNVRNKTPDYHSNASRAQKDNHVKDISINESASIVLDLSQFKKKSNGDSEKIKPSEKNEKIVYKKQPNIKPQHITIDISEKRPIKKKQTYEFYSFWIYFLKFIV